MRVRGSHARQGLAESRSDPWWGVRASRVLNIVPEICRARAGPVGGSNYVSLARVIYIRAPSRAGRFAANHSHCAAAAGSRRPGSARKQLSRPESRAARLDEDDETESSTRFRSEPLRLRQRDLVDALSGRQERDEEVEAPFSLLRRANGGPVNQTELKGRPLRTFLSGS